jgi:hypothetical protein
MATRRAFRSRLSSLAAAAAIATVASMSGCQPKEGSEHTCACICYKDTGKEVFIFNQGVSTTKECGNVNGSPCTGNAGGQQIEGQYANCGPNPNVARAFFDSISNAVASKAPSASGRGAGGTGQGGGTGTGAAGSGQ